MVISAGGWRLSRVGRAGSGAATARVLAAARTKVLITDRIDGSDVAVKSAALICGTT
jgi:hypothetical protein